MLSLVSACMLSWWDKGGHTCPARLLPYFQKATRKTLNVRFNPYISDRANSVIEWLYDMDIVINKRSYPELDHNS